MSIRIVPDFPLRSTGLTQAIYSAGVEASLSQIPGAIDDFNAAATLAQLTTTTTSSSSVLIGTGAKTFTVPAGLGFVVGMTLRIANTSTKYMTGDVTSYSGTTLVVNVTAVTGSGTLASWAISLAATGASTAGTISFTPAGAIAATNVQTAIQELDTEKAALAGATFTGAISSANGELVRAGTLIDFAGTSAPTGYLACPISLTNISRVTYAALFTAIGTTWGAGDGSTTFGLPWFDANYAAVQSNSNVGTTTTGENISHTHIQTAHTHSYGDYDATEIDSAGSGSFAGGASSGTTGSTTAVNQNQGGSANLAAGVRVLKCIKF